MGPDLFQAHVELLRLFLRHRGDIVESIDAVLNAQRKSMRYLQDQSVLSRRFEDCFFAHPAVATDQTRLRGQLEDAYGAAGFTPRQVQHVYNDLIHPAEMMIRAFHCWQQTQWPGRNGRMHYAQTLFNLYVIRCLGFLSLRIWDEDPSSAGGRLAEIQRVLGELWRSSPADQPVMVRDARWLIPLAQSLITDELAPYLEIARLVTETLPKEDAREIQKAHVRMLGGHLTSQIRHYCARDGVPINDPSVVGRTRTSNALDFALLIQALVELLKAYECALRSGEEPMRLEMAGAICQGISADPELFLNRIDLLSAYSMMEHVFLDGAGRRQASADREAHAGYSSLGHRHLELLKEYGELIDRLTAPLRDDFPRFRPVAGGYSPYGVMFGIPSNLIEHMALKTIERDAETRFGLEDVFEDVFDDGDRIGEISAAKLAWVNGWRNLPHIDPEVQRMYEYPQQFAEEIYERIGQALTRASRAMPRDSNAAPGDGSGTGRLYIESADTRGADANAAVVAELPTRYFLSSDKQVVAAHKAELYDQAQLLRERREAHFLVSYETPGGWIALRKELLTEVLGKGRDARIAGLPGEAAAVLRLMCRDLVMPETVADRAGVQD